MSDFYEGELYDMHQQKAPLPWDRLDRLGVGDTGHALRWFDVNALVPLTCSGTNAVGYIPAPRGLPRCAYCRCRVTHDAIRCVSCGAPQ